MKLTLKVYPRWTEQQIAIMEELSFHTTKIYNIANHQCREQQYKSYQTLERELKSNWHKEYLHSHTYQQCLKVLEQNWKSYFNAIKDYQKHPHKYKAMPQPPRYKHIEKRKNEIIFTNYAIRKQEGFLLLSLSKKLQQEFSVDSLKVEVQQLPLPKEPHIQQIRIQYDRTKKAWYLLVIYKVEKKAENDASHLMAIDVGLDNLAAITFSHSKDQYLISGKQLKSINGFINKQIAHFQSIRMKQVGAKAFKSTKRIQTLRIKRHHILQNYLHQASRKVIELAKAYQVGIIVIGDIKNIKHHNSIKNFVQIPTMRFIRMMQYKAELEGIKIQFQNEAYTSRVSAIDLEPITKEYYNKSRRIERGLFRTNQNKLINADINGSLNILRQAYQGIPKLIESVRDNGCVNHPKRIRVA